MVVKDVIDLYSRVVKYVEIFGATLEFLDEFTLKAEGISEAICAEHQIGNGSVFAILSYQDGTTLGPESTKLFLELKSWLATQNTAFSKLVS